MYTCPWAIAPTTKAIGASWETSSDGLIGFSAENDVATFRQPAGKWSVIGFLITFINLADVSAALTLNLCNNWTKNKNIKCI